MKGDAPIQESKKSAGTKEYASRFVVFHLSALSDEHRKTLQSVRVQSGGETIDENASAHMLWILVSPIHALVRPFYPVRRERTEESRYKKVYVRLITKSGPYENCVLMSLERRMWEAAANLV